MNFRKLQTHAHTEVNLPRGTGKTLYTECLLYLVTISISSKSTPFFKIPGKQANTGQSNCLGKYLRQLRYMLSNYLSLYFKDTQAFLSAFTCDYWDTCLPNYKVAILKHGSGIIVYPLAEPFYFHFRASGTAHLS